MRKNIAVSEDVYKQAAKAAAADRVSIDEFVSAMLSKQLTEREFIEKRGLLFQRENLI